MAGRQKSRKGKHNPGLTGRESGRPTIGLFVDRVDRPYEARKWWGAVDAARAHDANLICFPTGFWYDHDDPAANFVDLTDSRSDDHPGRSHLSNVLFDVAGPETLDGLILCAGIWGALVREDHVEKRAGFLARYRSLPLICAEVTFEGLPGVFADDVRGARDALVHLIEVHGRRRIAFVWGMRHHPWIRERFRIYTETLVQHGLPVDPDLVFAPHWEYPSYDDWPLSPNRLPPQVPFDAVLACYDAVAIEVLAALRARGIRVPGDVAVIGFDDDVEGRAAVPSLTTVQTSCYEIGVKAVEAVLALIEGRQVPGRVVLPMPLVVRESCGCPSAPVLDAGLDGVAPAGGSPADALAARRAQILSTMREAAGEGGGTSIPAGRSSCWMAFSPPWTGRRRALSSRAWTTF